MSNQPRTAAAVGYCRRSTDRQEQSIGDQRAAIERYAEAHDLCLQRHYVDDAISGTSTSGRKAFLRLIADAKRPDRSFSCVVCYDVKRFGRVGNDEAGYYRNVLWTCGVEVCYAAENFTGDSTDDLLRPVKQWQARQESKDLARVTIRGLVSKARAGGGWWMGGVPPYGYDLRYESSDGAFIFIVRYARDGSKRLLDEDGAVARTLPRGESIAVSKRDRCRLVPGGAERIAAVGRVFELYAVERVGYRAIAERFNREGVPSARGPDWSPRYSGRWSMASVRAILNNPAYAGDLCWNRRTDGRFYRIGPDGEASERKGPTRRRLEPNGRGDWIVVRDAHEPLIDRMLWLRAESIRTGKPGSERQRGINPRTQRAAGLPELEGARARFLLSGLATCSRCGSTYEGRVHRPGSNQTGRWYGYACGGYIRQGRAVCTSGFIAQDTLEQAVIAAVGKAYAVYEGDKGDAKLRRAVTQILKTQGDGLQAERAELEAGLERIDGVIRNLLDNITPVNRTAVDDRLTELAVERRELEAGLTRAEAAAAGQANVDSAVREARAVLRRLTDRLDGTDIEQRRLMLRRCVAGIVIERDAGRARIAIRKLPVSPALPDELPVVEKTVLVTMRA